MAHFMSIKDVFHIICVLTTIGLVIWCIHEYRLDHDFTETKFKKFHETDEDMYPSFTICNSDPVDKKVSLQSLHYIRTLPITTKEISNEEFFTFYNRVYAIWINFMYFIGGNSYSLKRSGLLRKNTY